MLEAIIKEVKFCHANSQLLKIRLTMLLNQGSTRDQFGLSARFQKMDLRTSVYRKSRSRTMTTTSYSSRTSDRSYIPLKRRLRRSRAKPSSFNTYIRKHETFCTISSVTFSDGSITSSIHPFAISSSHGRQQMIESFITRRTRRPSSQYLSDSDTDSDDISKDRNPMFPQLL